MSSTRDKIIVLLELNGSMQTEEVAKAVEMTASAVRFHLRILEHNGRITREQEGKGFIWRALADGEEVPAIHGKAGPVDDNPRIMDALRDGAMRSGELVAITGIPKKRVGYLLNQLEEAGQVERTGEKSQTMWSIAKHRGPGRKVQGLSVLAALDEQRESPIGRFLTQPAGVPV